ncbi:hypothetical protein WDW89_17120 [Deltaproteobacteria bacterium TL4]
MIIRVFIASLMGLVLLFVLPLHAYQPTWQDLLSSLLKQNLWYRIILETNVQVFDPFSENTSQPHPQELKSRGYKQVIYWKRDTNLAIETLDLQNNLLHFYYETEGNVIKASTSTERTFTQKEIMPHFLRFVTQSEKNWEYALKEMDIDSRHISLHPEESEIFYRIGQPDSSHYALIEKPNYQLHALYQRFQSKDGKAHLIRILFKNFKNYGGQSYPQQTEYYLDEHLFKRVNVTAVKRASRLPVAELNKLIEKWKTSQVADLNINYIQ